MSLVPTTMWGQGTLSPKAAITISGNGMKKAKAQGVDNKKVSAYVTINANITSWLDAYSRRWQYRYRQTIIKRVKGISR